MVVAVTQAVVRGQRLGMPSRCRGPIGSGAHGGVVVGHISPPSLVAA